MRRILRRISISAGCNEWRGANVDVMIQDELNHPSLFLANHLIRNRCTFPLLGLVHHLRTSETHPRLLRQLYRPVERAFLRTLDGFIANSHTTLASVNALAPQTKASLIAYPAADHLPGAPITQQALAHRTGQAPPLRILFVGNVVPRKAVHTLVAALGQVDPSLWRLTIVGSTDVDRDYARQVKTQAAALGVKTQVEWTGRLSDVQLVAAYKAHHLLAMPSYEGFGIVYLEAMRYGLPVIASTSGAAREVVVHGANGFLIAPQDTAAIARHVRQLATNSPQRAAMSFAAVGQYQRHPTWAQSMQSIVEWLGHFRTQPFAHQSAQSRNHHGLQL